MAEQRQHRPTVTMRGPQVVDLAEAQRFDPETGASQPIQISAWQPASSG
ncbi:MAG: hypothetical protein U1F20_04500 [Lysobacterales bacterium]